MTFIVSVIIIVNKPGEQHRLSWQKPSFAFFTVHCVLLGAHGRVDLAV